MLHISQHHVAIYSILIIIKINDNINIKIKGGDEMRCQLCSVTEFVLGMFFIGLIIVAMCAVICIHY